MSGTASRRRPSRRRVLTVGVCMALAVATLTAVSATTALSAHGPSAVGAAPVCQSDGNGGCTAVIPCPSGPCPTVDVAPATGLSDGEFVFVRATNFRAGGSIRVALCTTGSSASDPQCLVGLWESQQWGPVQTPVTVDAAHANLTETAYPAFFDESGEGNSPLPSHDITNVQGAGPGFFCDNTADPCVIEITKEAGTGNSVGNGPPVSTSNTAVIPLTFAAQEAGCPSTAPEIQTESSTSLEHFLPAAVDSTCGGTNGVVALNTTNDNGSVVSNFNSGNTNLAFIDNPGDLNQAGTLFDGRPFAYIPIAVSATVVSMLAGETVGDTATPLANYNLTPNMVAGLISTDYSSATGSGTLDPLTFYGGDYPHLPFPCKELTLCTGPNPVTELQNQLQYFSAFDLLNPPTASGLGVYMPQQFGAFNSDVPNGASYQVTDWLCNAPTVPYTASFKLVGKSSPVSASVHDTTVAGTTLTTPPVGSNIWPPSDDRSATWIFPSCQPSSTIPPLASGISTYGESQLPSLQAHAMRTYAFGGSTVPFFSTDPAAAFGVMDSSEASFYGLYTASLQNAAGNFVTPTVASLEAGLANLTPCPTGTLSCPVGTYKVDYTTPTPDAYPMPDVTYAMVPTTPLPASTATEMKDLLTNLVNYSHSGGSIPLPNGYAPLPSTLYQAALADIAKDVVAQPGSGSSTAAGGGSQSTGSGGSGATTGGSSPSGQTNPYASTAGGATGPGSLPLSTSSPTGKGRSHPRGSGTGGPGGLGMATGFILVALDAAARYLLPALVILAIACLIFGPLLLFAPELTRLRRREQESGEPPGEPPGAAA